MVFFNETYTVKTFIQVSTVDVVDMDCCVTVEGEVAEAAAVLVVASFPNISVRTHPLSLESFSPVTMKDINIIYLFTNYLFYIGI